MHLDEEAPTVDGRRITGSGWHMCALAMRMQVDSVIGRAASVGGLRVTRQSGSRRFVPATT